jgi:hypothetical protein
VSDDQLRDAVRAMGEIRNLEASVERDHH